jgi:hypothetical protein
MAALTKKAAQLVPFCQLSACCFMLPYDAPPLLLHTSSTLYIRGESWLHAFQSVGTLVVVNEEGYVLQFF